MANTKKNDTPLRDTGEAWPPAPKSQHMSKVIIGTEKRHQSRQVGLISLCLSMTVTITEAGLLGPLLYEVIRYGDIGPMFTENGFFGFIPYAAANWATIVLCVLAFLTGLFAWRSIPGKVGIALSIVATAVRCSLWNAYFGPVH